MEIKRLTYEEYAAAFDRHAPHVYNTTAFNRHNAAKADGGLTYLGFADRSLRMGIIVGERQGRLLSPFSAPFGGLTMSGRQSAGHVAEAARLLAGYGRERGKKVTVTLPPSIYAPASTAMQTVAFAAAGRPDYADINHHRALDAPAAEGLLQKARNQRNFALRQGFGFEAATEPDAAFIERVYAVIERNHTELGHPLRMTLADVESTAPLTGSMFFVMTHAGRDVAAAMVNRSAAGVAQVIYWGDTLEARSLHPMTLLATEVMDACREAGATTFDIGPSSERGEVAAGLCRFKESLGCTATVKPTFTLD